VNSKISSCPIPENAAKFDFGEGGPNLWVTRRRINLLESEKDPCHSPVGWEASMAKKRRKMAKAAKKGAKKTKPRRRVNGLHPVWMTPG
jgi:hypothetical protein